MEHACGPLTGGNLEQDQAPAAPNPLIPLSSVGMPTLPFPIRFSGIPSKASSAGLPGPPGRSPQSALSGGACPGDRSIHHRIDLDQCLTESTVARSAATDY